MEKVNEILRKKTVYKLSLAEFKKGEWAKNIDINPDIEITYRIGYLTVATINDKQK